MFIRFCLHLSVSVVGSLERPFEPAQGSGERGYGGGNGGSGWERQSRHSREREGIDDKFPRKIDIRPSNKYAKETARLTVQVRKEERVTITNQLDRPSFVPKALSIKIVTSIFRFTRP